MSRKLDRIVIEGYKSIEACDLQLGPLNVLVGPNGAGKSNFISVFGLLGHIVQEDLQLSVARAGGASTLLHGGTRMTESLRLHTYFGRNQYEARLVLGARDDLLFETETSYFRGSGYSDDEAFGVGLGSGQRESNLRVVASSEKVAAYCLAAMETWRVFHFHDTSAQAGAKQKQQLGDDESLRSDASNLAPFLFMLRESEREAYDRIVDAVRLVAPFFQDFRLAPDRVNKERIQLEWRQVGSDAYFNGHALSDGTLRFMCLATLLLQPDPPSLIVIDEPELGLHPFAITQLGGMLEAASEQRQLLVSTQSVTLLNQLDPEYLIITEQRDGATSFVRPDLDALDAWMEEYAVGELWERNALGGRPYS